MTAAKNLDFLARQDWERRIKEVFKEAAPRFKVLKKNILDHQRAIEKARKAAEQEAKKAAAAATRAERARGRGRGTRGGRQGRGRGARGRGAAAAEGSGAGVDDLNSEPSEVTKPSGVAESSESDSDSDSDSEAEIPIPRSRRQRQIRVIQGRYGEAAVREVNQEVVVEDNGNQPTEQPQPRPRPHPRMRKSPLEAQDVGEVEEPHDGNAVERENEPGMLQGRGEEEHAIGPEIGINLVPGITDGGLEAHGGRVEELSRMQSGNIEAQAGQQRRRNPRRGKQSDTANS